MVLFYINLHSFTTKNNDEFKKSDICDVVVGGQGCGKKTLNFRLLNFRVFDFGLPTFGLLNFGLLDFMPKINFFTKSLYGKSWTDPIAICYFLGKQLPYV